MIRMHVTSLGDGPRFVLGKAACDRCKLVEWAHQAVRLPVDNRACPTLSSAPAVRHRHHACVRSSPVPPSCEAESSPKLHFQATSVIVTRTTLSPSVRIQSIQTEHRIRARSTAYSQSLSRSFMQSEPTKASQHAPTPENAPHPPPTSQHGQPRDDDLQDSLRPHSGEQQRGPEPPSGGKDRDATHSSATSSDGNAVETFGLKGNDASTSPPRNRISEYENARVKTPKKPCEGPLFEVIKSNRRPDDKSSPIAKLPNGECSVCLRFNGEVLTSSRGLDSCHCPSLAERPRRSVPRVAPLQRPGHHTSRMAGCFWSLLPRSASP